MPTIFSVKPEPLELRVRAGRWWWVSAWLPTAIAISIIMRESTPLFSAANTSHFLRPLIERIIGHLSDDTWDLLHTLFRKTGHFCGYGMVCMTFLRGWLLTLGRRVDLPPGRWRLLSTVYAVMGTFLVASGDEFHQTFLPSRHGQFPDVLLDTCGGLVFSGLVWVLFWRRRKVLR
jgi:VanZ family protein